MELINPYHKFVASISATEFEKYCFTILTAYAEEECLKDFTITHNHKVQTYDGDYQIDIYAEFLALGVRFKVIIECKRYTRPVEREKVVALVDKVRSLGGQKGILISTSGFQRGAMEYAAKHGIALLQIFDKHIMHIQNSMQTKINVLEKELIRQSPNYYTYEWNSEYDFPDKRIYPSKSMILKLMESIKNQFCIENEGFINDK